MNLFAAALAPSDLALVVFSDRTGIWWMRLLRRGYRHCFVILPGEVAGARCWVLADSLPNRVALQLVDTESLIRLLRHLVRRGDRVVPVRAVRRPPARRRRMRPFSCVELSVRLLGLQSLNVLTPYGFFRSLSEM